MERHDLEQRLKRMRRVPAPEGLDRRMGPLFEDAAEPTTEHGLEERLDRMEALLHGADGQTAAPGLESRLTEMGRVPVPPTLDRQVEALFDGAAGRTAAPGLESRLGRMGRVPVPTTLDRRMAALFDGAADRPARHPWRAPAWAMAAAGLVLVLVFLINGGTGPEPVVVEITPQGQLEQFLLGGAAPAAADGLELFTRGQCTVETVWPANAPSLDRHPVNGSTGNGDG